MNLEKFIIIKTNDVITFEEEIEIVDLVKQVLKRNDETRKVCSWKFGIK